MQVLTIEQLSSVLHKSPASIKSDRLRNPQALPPSFSLPSSRRVLFLQEDVESWLRAQAQQAQQTEPMAIKRGRPTHASKLSKQ